MRIRKWISVVFMLIVLNILALGQEPRGEDFKVWFDQPADKLAPSEFQSWLVESPDYTNKNNPDKAWHNYVLPLGNGAMGAGVYGGVAIERIQLNEKSIWTGGPGNKDFKLADTPDAYKKTEDIRRLVLDGDIKSAEEMSNKTLRSGWTEEEYMRFFGAYQTFGELNITTGLDEANVKKYKRELDISTGVITIDFEIDGVKYKREMFCSYPAKSLVVRFSADKPQQQNLFLNLSSPHKLKSDAEDGCFVAKGEVSGNGLLVETRISVENEAGNSSISEKGIKVSAANSVTFVLSIGTNYVMEYPNMFGDAPSSKLKTIVKDASMQSFAELKQKHLFDFGSLFNRVAIDLGGATASQLKLTTDKRVIQNATTPDYGLEALYFQFGRYLLISSSRPGSLPANLQGVWCNEIVPAWFSDYHLNINLQMNYWPAGVCNLLECQEPLIDYISFLSKPGKTTAKYYNNASGWTAHLHSNIWGFTAPNPSENAPVFWKWFPMGGPWLSQHVWEQYSFSQDKKYLEEKAYPLLKGSSEFIEGYVTQLPSGELSSFPSWSPEHGSLSKGATMDIAVMRETLTNTIKAANILGVDHEKIKEWQRISDGLVKYKIGKFGQLQEWYEDIDDPNNKHRHVNHLFGLHPGNEISPIKTPELAKAARVSLEHRGDGGTGWSMGWKINFWTRLLDGERAYNLFRNLLVERTLPNLWDSHPPFQIDGNFGGTAGVAEMLLQSHAGFIHILPALPSAWGSGSVQGLMARGNVEVDIEWNAGELVEAKLHVYVDGEYMIRYGSETRVLSLKAGDVVFLNNELALEKGESQK